MKTKPVTVGAIATEYVRLLFIYCIYVWRRNQSYTVASDPARFLCKIQIIFSIVQPKTFFLQDLTHPKICPHSGGEGG